MASKTLSEDLVQALDNLFGLHPGFRPVHAKGMFFSGDFTPSPQAASLTRAPHAQRQTTPVTVRFSDFAGIPTVPDNDPNVAGPRGFAVRFHLGEHVHTDIVGHSHDGFPTRTGEEFLEFARALATTGPDSPKPTPLDSFLGSHPKALEFAVAPKPIPTSFAREAFFGVNAFRFTNKDGASRFGRYRIVPEAGRDYLDAAAAAAAKSKDFLFDEIVSRINGGPVRFRILVQLANAGDTVNDATIHWPEDRTQLDFGTINLTRQSPDDGEHRRLIFDPIPRVDGIDPSDDPLIELRAAIYLLTGRRRRAASQAAAT